MSPEPLKLPAKKVAERLATIVDAAERAALEVIDDAEKEAQRYLEEAQERADRIVAEKLREAADALEGQRANGDGPLLRSVELEPQADQEPPPEQTVVAAEPHAKSDGSAAARLLATQMAVSGSSRMEIEMRLRSGFEIEDTSEILDAILGPED
jgi:hypothetical protein